MSRTLPISEVKTHLPELVLSVEECEEEIIVTRKGRPAAVIINVDEYARLRETLDVLGDADLMKNIRRGRAYFRRGAKGVPMDRVFPKASAKSPKRKIVAAWRIVFATEAAAAVRGLPPDVKRIVREALLAIGVNPYVGKELLRELQGLRSYQARRYRIVYELASPRREIRIVAVAHRSSVYEDVARSRLAGR